MLMLSEGQPATQCFLLHLKCMAIWRQKVGHCPLVGRVFHSVAQLQAY